MHKRNHIRQCNKAVVSKTLHFLMHAFKSNELVQHESTEPRGNKLFTNLEDFIAHISSVRCYLYQMSSLSDVTSIRCHLYHMPSLSQITPLSVVTYVTSIRWYLYWCHLYQILPMSDVTSIRCHLHQMSPLSNVTSIRCHSIKCHHYQMLLLSGNFLLSSEIQRFLSIKWVHQFFK